VAALGALYNKANSPKASPLTYVFNNFSSPSIFLKQSNSPESTKYKQSPSSPYLITVSSTANFFSSIAPTTIDYSFSSKA